MNRLAAGILGLLFALPVNTRAGTPIQLDVDATDVVRGILHAKLLIPAAPGPLRLAYPKWIPGEHAADGPLTQMVGLEFSAQGKPLAWLRDTKDAFVFQLEVPPGAGAVEARFDYLSPSKGFGDGYGKTPSVTPHLLIIPFNQVLVYPLGTPTDAMPVQARVRIPAGWKSDCALATQPEAGTLRLPEVSVSTLVDSPLLAGEFFRSIPLTTGAGATRISIAAEAAADLALGDEQVPLLKRLVAEANLLFGGRRYREYVWLVALADRIDTNGLEHHESTDIREGEAFFTDPAQRLRHGSVIAHEYVHSWNGKYRRPAGLATRDFQEPMADDLLWVYEGMTRYLGDLVLPARSGLSTPEEVRDRIAWIAAAMDLARPGRNWRSLGDTAAALPSYGDAPTEWVPIRRPRDFYDEMGLVWLEVDTILRTRSGGKRSFDDFCQAFFGAAEKKAAVEPYTRADLIQALAATVEYDWSGFFAARIDGTSAHAPLLGVLGSGWKLVYNEVPNPYLAAREKLASTTDLSFSLGIQVRSDGTVADVVHGSPAFASGVAPGMRLLGIDGHKWSDAAARAALLRAKDQPGTIDLVVEMADLVRTLRVDDHGGLRHPHLERESSKPDLLAAILEPRSRSNR